MANQSYTDSLKMAAAQSKILEGFADLMDVVVRLSNRESSQKELSFIDQNIEKMTSGLTRSLELTQGALMKAGPLGPQLSATVEDLGTAQSELSEISLGVSLARGQLMECLEGARSLMHETRQDTQRSVSGFGHAREILEDANLLSKDFDTLDSDVRKIDEAMRSQVGVFSQVMSESLTMRNQLENMRTSMQNNFAQVSGVQDKIKTLANRVADISHIIDAIVDISEQTNLLALNASIEAARAGEQGKGFAVVADDIRKLAERSSSATKDIYDRIEAIQEETQNALSEIQDGTKTVELGVVTACEAEFKLRVFREKLSNLTKITIGLDDLVGNCRNATLTNSNRTRGILQAAKLVAGACDLYSNVATKLESQMSQFVMVLGSTTSRMNQEGGKLALVNPLISKGTQRLEAQRDAVVQFQEDLKGVLDQTQAARTASQEVKNLSNVTNEKIKRNKGDFGKIEKIAQGVLLSVDSLSSVVGNGGQDLGDRRNYSHGTEDNGNGDDRSQHQQGAA